MSKNKFGIGIVGCGTISATHAQAIKNTPNAKVVAAHSRSSSRLAAFCDEYGTVGFSNYEEFLLHDDVDIVVICTPSGTHLDYGKLAAEAHKHLIVEKPIEVSVARGQALIECCQNNGVKLAVIYQNRFLEDAIRMKQLIDDGELGSLFMADVSVPWFRDQQYYDGAPWRGTFKLDGGGAAINQAIHTIDLMLWFAGDVASVHAFKGTFTHQRIEAEDNITASLQFKNGTIGTFRASTSVVPSQNRKIEIFGEKGTALLDGDAFYMIKSDKDIKNGSDGGDAVGASSPLAGMTGNKHKKQYDQILDACKNNKEPVVSGADSLRSLVIVKAMYESAETERVVLVDEVLPKG